MTIFEMKQERAKIVAQMHEITERNNESVMSAEDNAAYAKASKDFDAISAHIDAMERQQEIDRKMGEIADKKVEKNDDLATAFSNHLRMGNQKTLEAYNAISQDVATQAGNLVAPQQFVSELIKELDNTMPIRQFAKKYTLQGAQSLGFPKRTARMNSAAWGTETSEPKADTALTIGKREFKPNFATAEILVSRTLINNAPNVDAIVRGEVAYNMGELLENAYMTGDGNAKPLGLFTADDCGISTARDIATGNTATDITFDGLMEAKYAIKGQYQPNLRWLFHRDALKQIAKIKDSNGQYIWQPSVADGVADRLLGIPVITSEYAPNTFAAGKYVGILGDFGYYWICDSANMELQVLSELYARSNQIDYIARLATDGMPVLEECFARVTLAGAAGK